MSPLWWKTLFHTYSISSHNLNLIRSGAIFATRPLTDTQWEVKDAESNVQPEEEDHVGHFAKQEQVAHVLLQCDWEREEGTMNAAEGEKNNLHIADTRSEGGEIRFTQQSKVSSKALPGSGFSPTHTCISYTLCHKYRIGRSLKVTQW